MLLFYKKSRQQLGNQIGLEKSTTWINEEDEKREYDPKTKMNNVVNAQKVIFQKDSYLETDRKTANWIMKIWPFVKEIGLVEEASKGEPVKPEVVPDLTSEDEFSQLQSIGYKNLKGADRELYTKLKKELNK